jgi:hypothetical protein
METPPHKPAPNRGHKGAERPDVCIFCEGADPSREHLFPEWTQKYVPAGADATHKESSNAAPAATVLGSGETVEDAFPTHQEYTVVRHRDAAHVQFYGPCRDCNGGWMSRLEIEAEAVLAPILRDEPHVISVAAQAILAKWITLRSIVGETGWLDRTNFSPARRRQFMDRPERFATSRIFIGRSLRADSRDFQGSSEPEYVPELGRRSATPFYTTLHLGPLVAVLFYVPEPIREDLPNFPPELFFFDTAIAPFLRELMRPGDAVTIEWPLPHAIQHPHPFKEICDWYQFLARMTQRVCLEIMARQARNPLP